MSTTLPRTLEQKIAGLVPDVDAAVRTELQQVLRTLHDAGNSIGVLLAMSRLSLRLTGQLYAATGRKPPSDNLFDRIEEAVKQRTLPAEMASCLHTVRTLSNKADHDAEKVALTVADAENALNLFLRVLEWFYCESEHGPRWPSIYAAELAPPVTIAHMLETFLRSHQAPERDTAAVAGATEKPSDDEDLAVVERQTGPYGLFREIGYRGVNFIRRHKIGGLAGCAAGVVLFMAGLFSTGLPTTHYQQLIESAYERLRAGQLEEATRHFQALVGVRPAAAYEGLAAVALQQNELSKAESLCADALRLDAQRAGCLLIQGDLHVLQGNLTRAVSAYEAVQTLPGATDAQRAVAYNRLGRLAAEQGQTDRAAAAYAKAQALDPQNWESLSNLGALLQQQGRFAEAVGLLHKAAALRPDDPLIQTLLHASQEAEALAKDRSRQDRIDRLVEELTQRYRRGDLVRPQAEADEWTSRPLTLWLPGLERRGWVSFREGEDEFFLRKLADVLEGQTRVRLVERTILEKLLDELKLSTSALIDPQTALRLGRLLSARLIATGSIAAVGAEWQLTLRVIETETSAVTASVAQSFPLSQPIHEVAEPVGKQLGEKILRLYPLRARVLDVGNGEVTLNVGAVDGAAPGLRLQLFRENAPGLREDIAEVELVEVQEKHSRAKLLYERVPVEGGLKARQLL